MNRRINLVLRVEQELEDCLIPPGRSYKNERSDLLLWVDTYRRFALMLWVKEKLKDFFSM